MSYKSILGRYILAPVALITLIVLLPIEAPTYLVSGPWAVKVIVGEAADQPLAGMVAVAEVIRRRGGLKGFSTLNRDLDRFVDDQSPQTRLKAELAWKLSRFTNLSRGATHFENVVAFGMPSWAKGMEITIQIKDLTFFSKPIDGL